MRRFNRTQQVKRNAIRRARRLHPYFRCVDANMSDEARYGVHGGLQGYREYMENMRRLRRW